MHGRSVKTMLHVSRHAPTQKVQPQSLQVECALPQLLAYLLPVCLEEGGSEKTRLGRQRGRLRLGALGFGSRKPVGRRGCRARNHLRCRAICDGGGIQRREARKGCVCWRLALCRRHSWRCCDGRQRGANLAVCEKPCEIIVLISHGRRCACSYRHCYMYG